MVKIPMTMMVTARWNAEKKSLIMNILIIFDGFFGDLDT